jgi:hypothetical protein
MKVAPIEYEDISSLLSWHVNIYQLNNRKHILFVNDLSRLSIIIDGIRTSQLTLLKDKFLTVLKTYLINEGLNQNQIDAYLREGSEFVISKTNSRSVLGTMNEVSFFSSDDFNDNIERLKFLNKIIYKPIDYEEPKIVFKEAINRHYS